MVGDAVVDLVVSLGCTLGSNAGWEATSGEKHDDVVCHRYESCCNYCCWGKSVDTECR